jgi:hypothetical protein
MTNRSLKIPVIIFSIGLVLALVAYMLTGIVKTPAVTQQDFAYSATYRLNGETKKLEGVYRCQFRYTNKGTDPLERYYEGFYLSDPLAGEPEAHTIARQDDLELRIVFIFYDDYLMGDGDRGAQYSYAIPEPYLAVYDEMGVEYTDPETLEKFDAELLSWETPQPIENHFVFSGFSILHDGSMLVMLLVGILVIVACMIFVKRDKNVSYQFIDKISIILNFIVAIVVVPFMTLVVLLMQIYVSGEELTYQADLCVPAITAFTIAASIALRRKGFAKSGFFIQFVGPLLFVLLALLE